MPPFNEATDLSGWWIYLRFLLRGSRQRRISLRWYDCNLLSRVKPAIVNDLILTHAQIADAVYFIRQHSCNDERAHPWVMELAGASSWW